MKTRQILQTGLLLLASAIAGAQTLPSNPIYTYTVPSGGYAPNSNLSNYTDKITGGWSMQYDSLNRLQGATAANGLYGNTSVGWQYDSFGNRLNQTVTGASGSSAPSVWATYDANNRMVTNQNSVAANSLQYDGGNMAFDGVNFYVYDAENRLCAMYSEGTITQYLYDAEGRRIAKGHPPVFAEGLYCPSSRADFIPDTTYILDQNGEQVSELDGNGVWKHTNVYAGGQLIATYDQEGTQQLLHFHVTDPLGTRRVQTTASGSPEQTYLSLPFGDGLTIAGNGQDATEHHFTGKERDTESGLDYFGARYYSSNMGRFSSPDPSQLYYANPGNPQSLNLYAYGRNNPLVNIDPTGTDCIHLNNDTGNYEGTDTGDCDNSTEAKANTGHYVDGTVTSLQYNTGTGNYNFQYNPYDQTSSTSTIGSGVIAGAGQPITINMSADVLNFASSQTVPVHGLYQYGNYAGSGGMGIPRNNADAGALQHDYCYHQGNFSAGTNFGGHNGALQACNQALCDTESSVATDLEAKARSTGANNLYEGLSPGDFAQYGAAKDIMSYFSIVPFGNSCRSNK
jgi:RHS repeat-associated protein